jgi:hypothetical protein
MAGKPKPLDQKEGKQPRRYALREIKAEAANPAKAKGHYVQRSRFQSKRRSRASLIKADSAGAKERRDLP